MASDPKMSPATSQVLLCASMILSGNSFLGMFKTGDQRPHITTADTVGSVICIAAAGFTFEQNSAAAGICVVVASMMIAPFLGLALTRDLAVIAATLGLLTYLASR